VPAEPAGPVLWTRFERGGAPGFGRLVDGDIHVHEGDMFADPRPTGEILAADAVALLPPVVPTKIVALWNNCRALADKLGNAVPQHPLYLMKALSSVAGPGETIRRPVSYSGRVVFEGELGIVVGRACKDADVEEAEAAIFGYTCVNDVTAADLINEDKGFAQWVRAKSFDGFGAFGPVVAAGIDPASLIVRTVLDGSERQNYPVSNFFFSPAELVSRISHDMTLLPGDLICCGTSIGVGSMKEPENLVEVVIDGVGTLSNRFVQ
jgi:2-keto-4-pentenoate hydratase/2-oxohepta-3-ene-1,7-dioic acid hydratase in catechol pathway